MSLGQRLYRTATRAAEPFLGLLVKQRLSKGKEIAGRTEERFARNVPDATPANLIWLHGASIGETALLLELAKQIGGERADLHFLFTSQTTTSAQLIADAISASPELQDRSTHQFAPIDTPAVAARFIDTWQPATAIFAEGDIWPNLISEAHARGVKLALINARMTRSSITGWGKWPDFAKRVFSCFDLILAADARTADGLTSLAHRQVSSVGNLKSALPPPAVNGEQLNLLRDQFIGSRGCLTAVSTHEGEEELVIEAISQMSPRPALIIVPRHPERANDIANALHAKQMTFSTRSKGETPTPEDDVLLADTLGEVGLFASAADTVYLGGGHTPGVGGHNPLEILRLGRPILSGPDVFNFEDLMADLAKQTGFQFVSGAQDIARSFPATPPKEATRIMLEEKAQTPMNITLEALAPLLPAISR
ncbi:3-deoxy-D-manno-octulosonic acid transferase [Henriciella litoralis]|uniref:3-deoxy-D-manno-octulosonic acid transferase n=1 Tax=Henriciella litoralis TaxID=568102 RepID=UPI000A03C76F|nr:glycosyltransferase N-terminal domain-containing protein [Henriciella litoralis]